MKADNAWINRRRHHVCCLHWIDTNWTEANFSANTSPVAVGEKATPEPSSTSALCISQPSLWFLFAKVPDNRETSLLSRLHKIIPIFAWKEGIIWFNKQGSFMCLSMLKMIRSEGTWWITFLGIIWFNKQGYFMCLAMRKMIRSGGSWQITLFTKYLWETQLNLSIFGRNWPSCLVRNKELGVLWVSDSWGICSKGDLVCSSQSFESKWCLAINLSGQNTEPRFSTY